MFDPGRFWTTVLSGYNKTYSILLSNDRKCFVCLFTASSRRPRASMSGLTAMGSVLHFKTFRSPSSLQIFMPIGIFTLSLELLLTDLAFLDAVGFSVDVRQDSFRLRNSSYVSGGSCSCSILTSAEPPAVGHRDAAGFAL